MIRRHSLCELYFRLCCFVLPGLAFLVSGGVLCGAAVIRPLTLDHMYICLILQLVWIVAAEHFKVSSVEELISNPAWIRGCLAALATTYMSGLSILFFYRGESFSRLLMGSSAISVLAGVILLGTAFRKLLQRAAKTSDAVRVVIVGTNRFALELSERLQRDTLAPCETVAWVRIPGQELCPEIQGAVYEVQQITGLNLSGFADNVIIAVSPEVFPQVPSLISQLKRLALPIQVAVNFGSEHKVGSRVFQIGGAQMLDLSIAPAETLNYVILKRCFDIGFSVLFLAVAGIPMLLIALAVKLSSPGPIMFAQERVGINGRVFSILKFRTMRVAPSPDSDTVWGTANDSRRTAIGTFLRKSSLDELPQFINVLRGDMSVVGPRPERPHFVEKFAEQIDAYNSRHFLKSGITGWAQVNGWRGDTDIKKRVECDLYYVRNWSLIFDFQIVVKTFSAVLFARNAY